MAFSEEQEKQGMHFSLKMNSGPIGIDSPLPTLRLTSSSLNHFTKKDLTQVSTLLSMSMQREKKQMRGFMLAAMKSSMVKYTSLLAAHSCGCPFFVRR